MAWSECAAADREPCTGEAGAAAAGIEEIVLVTARREEKRAIDRYYSVPPSDLSHPRVAPWVELMGRVRVSTVVQEEPRGLGHAVLCAREAVGGQPFAVLLGDDLFSGPASATGALIESMRRSGGGGHNLLMEVPEDRTHLYGIAAGDPPSGGRLRVREMIEKPVPGEAPSRLACVGRYVLPPEVFDLLEATPPGRGGEIQLTDALVALIEGPGLWGVMLDGRRHDAGDVAGWVLANAGYGLRRPDVSARIRAGLLELLAEP